MCCVGTVLILSWFKPLAASDDSYNHNMRCVKQYGRRQLSAPASALGSRYHAETCHCLTGPSASWASPQTKVAVPFAATLLSLLCFGQAVRLAVHLGFLIRVKGVYKHTDLPLREEIVAMTERCSLYFTCGEGVLGIVGMNRNNS